jgi:hypothetical protein
LLAILQSKFNLKKDFELRISLLIFGTTKANYMDGYGIFLMIELARLAGLIDPNLEYDLTWVMGQNLYTDYSASKFNDTYEPEYERMTKYLKNKVKKDLAVSK